MNMDKDVKKVRAHLLIFGRVQGVSFRYYTIDMAQSLGIKGWVRN
jgi:acylphosphatase